jgi:hypothetical protein
VYRPIQNVTPTGFVPAGLATAVKLRVVSPPGFVQPKITIGAEDGFIIPGPFLPLIKNRQKTTLVGLLKTLKSQKKFDDLLKELSANGLRKRGLTEEQGIEVLRVLDGWAKTGSHSFGSWEEAVTAAVKQIGPSLVVFKSSSKSEVEDSPYDKIGAVFEFACMGAKFTTEHYQSITKTLVNIHGETTGGVAATEKHIALAASRFYLWRVELKSIFTCCLPCANLLLLSPVKLMCGVMRRILAGSVQQGKCKMMVTAFQQIYPIMTELSVMCTAGRVKKTAWANVRVAFVTAYWGVQAKNATKMCRELGSALRLLEADPLLILSGYEQKSDLSDGEVTELDLEFTYADDFTPLKIINLEVETEVPGKNSQWGDEGIAYYGDRWAGKAKRFQMLGKNAKLCFMIAPHQDMPLDYPDLIQEYVWLHYGLNITVVTPALIGLESIHRNLLALPQLGRLLARPAKRQRSRSFSSPSSGPPSQDGRKRSGSIV